MARCEGVQVSQGPIYPGCFPPGADPIGLFEIAYQRAVQQHVPTFVALPTPEPAAPPIEGMTLISPRPFISRIRVRRRGAR